MRRFFSAAAFCTVVLSAVFANAQTQIEVKVETVSNLGIAPVIAGFSDGSWDIFDVGGSASAALEDLAETGSPAGFAPPEGGPVFGNNPDPPIFTPGGMNATTFSVSDGNNIFNLAAMVLPSNDWFVGTDDGIDISSLLNAAQGTTLSFDLSTVYDAGTELEDFATAPGGPIIGVTTAGSGAPDVGADQGEMISMVTGADPFGSFANLEPSSLDTSAFNFSAPIARVTLTTVPEPTSFLLGLISLGGLSLVRRRR